MSECPEGDNVGAEPVETNQENEKPGTGNPVKKPKKPKQPQETQSPKTCVIAKPNETLIQFALSAPRLVTPPDEHRKRASRAT